MANQANWIDPYALTNKTEFFAVTSELFFYKSNVIQEKAPELFELLKKSYGYVPTPNQARPLNRLTDYFKIFKTI